MTAAPAAGRRRVLVVGVLGALLGLIALYVLAIQPLVGDEAAASTTLAGAQPPTGGVRAPLAQAPNPTPGPTPTPPPPETFEVFTARDPFQQLVQPPEDAGTAQGASPAPSQGGTTGDTSGTGGTGGGASPSPTSGPTGSESPSPSTTPQPLPTASPSPSPSPGSSGGAGGSTQVGATRVELIDVFESGGAPTVSVAVNGTGYTVGEGAEFGDRFRLLDVSGTCATFLFGDSRFTLCEGQSIRK